MTLPPEMLELAVGMIARVPELIDAFVPDVRAQIREEMERARKRLPKPGAISEAIEDAIERAASGDRAVTQARAETVIERYRIAPTTVGVLRGLTTSRALNPTEQEEMAIAAAFVDAGLDGELVPVVPRVLEVPHQIATPSLAAPVGAWSEPSNGED